MKIGYPTRGSKFTQQCFESISSNLADLKLGQTVQIVFDEASDGYSGDIRVEIDTKDTAYFGADWNNSDASRFPARIRGASHALLLLGLSGTYQISHHRNALSVRIVDETGRDGPPSRRPRPLVGEIEGVQVGDTFSSRKALIDAQIHNMTMHGISSDGLSIVLSGGYVDDVDDGDLVIYTGEGGRDSNSGRQQADQTLTRGNLALVRNCVAGNPVRVTRGYKLDSPFAPQEGYRYDGLYRIDGYWGENGIDGFWIWRYKLVRNEVQDNKIDELSHVAETSQESSAPPRSTVTTSRIVRNSASGNRVKEIYDFKCQICGMRLETPGGPYAEACHIRPLGRPHNGPDTPDNVLCLCPTHHVLVDYHAIHFGDEFNVVETGEALFVHPIHKVAVEHLRYHRGLIDG